MGELGSDFVCWLLQMFSLSTKVYERLCSISYCYCTGSKQKERGRGVAWHCEYHLLVKRLPIKNGGDFDTVTDFFTLAGFSIIIIVGWFVELLRAQKYVVRRQCDNTDVWTVPYNGSSSIILSVI